MRKLISYLKNLFISFLQDSQEPEVIECGCEAEAYKGYALIEGITLNPQLSDLPLFTEVEGSGIRALTEQHLDFLFNELMLSSNSQDPFSNDDIHVRCFLAGKMARHFTHNPTKWPLSILGINRGDGSSKPSWDSEWDDSPQHEILEFVHAYCWMRYVTDTSLAEMRKLRLGKHFEV